MRLLIVLFSFFTSVFSLFSQVVINEIQSRNRDCYQDKDLAFPDWIELYNSGTSTIDLTGYYLSDDTSNPTKWKFPAASIKAKDYLIAFASGKGVSSNTKTANHWETAVFSNDTWKYFIGTSQPSSTWKTIAFDDAAWSLGQGGLGFGDGDDLTTVPTGTTSVFIRKTFAIADTSKIVSAILSMDYDDGFIAYLNGTEIARKNMAASTYNVFASPDHEATMYLGGNPEDFTISSEVLKTILANGINVLSIQIHNSSTASSDLSAIPFLSFGFTDGGTYYSPTPSWFIVQPQTQTELHTNFKLDNDGETLVFSNPLGAAINTIKIPLLSPDHSYCHIPDGSLTWCFADTASPTKTNNNTICFQNYTAMPVISPNPGFYSTSPSITITANAGDIIHYTTNGDIPTENAPIYTGPITFDTTHVLRAKAFNKPNYIPSEIATSTFIVAENTDLPIVSVCTDSLNLWDYLTGIYVLGPNAETVQPNYGANFWQNWERDCHMEYYDKNKVQQINMNGLVKIHGGWTRANPKKGMTIKTEKYLPNSSLNYKFFADKNFTNMKSFALRACGNDWEYGHCRDALINQSLKHSKCDFISYSPCIVYLNGAYWGIYEIRELTNETYMENNYGIDKDSIDLIQGNDWALNGNTNKLNSVISFVTSNNMATAANYDKAKTMIDLENMVDYFIAETYYINDDWIGDWVGNVKSWIPQRPDGRLKYLFYDMDFGLGLYDPTGYTKDKLYDALNPLAQSDHGDMLKKLLANQTFKNYFINRYADLINTTLSPTTLNALVDQFYTLYKKEMPREWNRWFSYKMDTWDNAITNIRKFINLRPAYARNYVQSYFSLSAQTTVNLNIATDNKAGRIKISTITPTPFPWQGIYFKGIPVTLSAIENPGYTFSHWTINDGTNTTTNYNENLTLTFSTATISITANFNGAVDTAKLTISEINYHPDITHNTGDWFELHNYSNSTINLTNWYLRDTIFYNRFVFPLGTKIPANSYLVVCEDTMKFKTQFPNTKNILGNLGFNLSNNAETIHLFNCDHQEMLTLNYNDSVAWLKCTDGNGRTLELKQNDANINDPSNWHAGCMQGSPGIMHTTCSNQGVLIHEINYSSAPAAETGDWIELLNTSSNAIDISGWTFKDANDLHEFKFPANTSIAGESLLVLYADYNLFNYYHPDVNNKVGPFAFGLGANDDILRLFDQTGMLQFSMNYYNALPFPAEAHGGGYTLNLKDTSEIICDGNNWITNCLQGSPGTYCGTEGISQIKITSIKLYPIPANNYLSIVLPDNNQTFNISIYSMLGEKIYTSASLLNSTTNTININQLNKGIYLIELQNIVTLEKTIHKFIKN